MGEHKIPTEEGIIRNVHINPNSIRFSLRGYRGQLTDAYIMFTLADGQEPIHPLRLRRGRVPRRIDLERPADQCTFRLVAIKNPSETHLVQHGYIDGTTTAVMKKGIIFKS